MDLALNNQQRLRCYKTQTNKQYHETKPKPMLKNNSIFLIKNLANETKMKNV